jgi:xylulokinase
LPGDFIAMKFTEEITTTPSALSEGIFWDFAGNKVSDDVKDYFDFPGHLFPEVVPVFSTHGLVKETVAARLSLKKGIPVTYKAGDQPNNALSLNVFNPGEVAATAGTSGVIYAVSDHLEYDKQSRINGFAHVNHTAENVRIGNLLCINGAGIFNRWIKNITGANMQYSQLNEAAAGINIGSEGLLALPFGNGAERMLNNKIIGACFSNLDFNVHTSAHLVRAVQEGIAFSFRYGLDIMKENGMKPEVIRAGIANMFLSNVFAKSFAGATNTTIELYQCDGSIGAAIGAGLGAGFFNSKEEAFGEMKAVNTVEPENIEEFEEVYRSWKAELETRLQNQPFDLLTNDTGSKKRTVSIVKK